MLKNRNILCVSVPSWKANYASTIVELMKKMGAENKVLYVQNPYTIKDLLSALVKKDKKFPFKKVLGLSSGLETHSENNTEVHVLTPPLNLTINFLPQGFVYDQLLKFNGWLVRQSVKKHLHRLGMNRDLIHIVSFHPLMGVVNGRKFGENVLLYHCYDEIGHAHWMKNHGTDYENRFIGHTDAVVFTSQGLLEKKGSLNQNSYLVKNGADISLFSKAFNIDLPEKKIVGYIGSIDDRLDYDLLEYVAASMPDTIFQFIGRVVDEKAKSRLEKFDNIQFSGAKKLDELPAFVREFSAGIIPFVRNEFTKGIYPLKINEYLAAGLPVVSTDFGYLEDFKGIITIARDKEQFKNGLLDELGRDSNDKRISRQQVASRNSWDNRAEDLSQVIETTEARLGFKKQVYET